MAIDSVLSQTYKDIEYIVVDGASTDGTVDIVKSYGAHITKFISEPDKGIYNAMNKGIKMSTGNIVGILNADDFFYDTTVVQRVVEQFDAEIDAIYGDVVFVSSDNIHKRIRYFSSNKFNLNRFKYGLMPAHPSFYVKREHFDNYGYYKEDYRIGADFELLLRFIHNYKLKCKYLEFPFVTMRAGGVSNKDIKSKLILNREVLRACKENGIKTNLFNICLKYFLKIFEFLYLKRLKH